MSDAHAIEQPLPRPLLWGAALLMLGSIVTVVVARHQETGMTHMPAAAVVDKRLLRFADRSDGAVVVTDANTQQAVQVLASGTHNFVRGVMRGMARERRRDGIDAQPPFELTRWSDGRMSITDPSTGVVINLDVFGPTNAAAFQQFFAAARADAPTQPVTDSTHHELFDQASTTAGSANPTHF